MAKGYYLVIQDKTTCGGIITEGEMTHTILGKAVAREQDRVTCGKHPGTYSIIGHIPGDSVMGRKFAGTLHSFSSCPCKARFIPSMLMDTYEACGGSSDSSFFDTLLTGLMESNKNSHDDKKDVHICTHTDGAVQVANYILSEIKTNVKSQTAQLIRNCIDDDTLKQKRAEWDKLPFYAKSSPPPEPSLGAAMAIWYQTVKTGSTWDHKPKIRDKFSKFAVARPLPKSGTASRSYYHKFKRYDYFYDVWSNIHYGYVGLSVGFTESLLLKGSTWEQNMTPGAVGDDTLDDVTSMKIGFKLFHQHGKYAETLSANHILDALEITANNLLPVSKQQHWCWNMENPDHIEQ
ncbi:hypothetical protein C9426_33740 [Serratia sp. S1B]|nr:hypothetical protein C9426_33740 [Serratia sp. S1B]